MKTTGILGGMSEASTQTHDHERCDRARARPGKLHSPERLIRSPDFARIKAVPRADTWDRVGEILNRETRALKRDGADLLLLATNPAQADRADDAAFRSRWCMAITRRDSIRG